MDGIAGYQNILSCFQAQVARLLSINLSQIWMNFIEHDPASISVLLNFRHGDLVSMLQAMNLLKGNNSLNIRNSWGDTLGIPVCWATVGRTQWIRISHISDTREIMKSLPTDRDQYNRRVSFVEAKQKNVGSATIRLNPKCLEEIEAYRQHSLLPSSKNIAYSGMGAAQSSAFKSATAVAAQAAVAAQKRRLENQTSLTDIISERSEDEQNDALHDLLRLRQSNETLTYRSPNNKDVSFYWFPTMRYIGEDEDARKKMFDNFRRKMPKDEFEQFLSSCFGSCDTGISIFLAYFNSINPDRFEQMLMELGIATRPRQYTLTQGLTLKDYVPLTWRQLERCSMMLQTFDGSKIPPIPNRHVLSLFEKGQFTDTCNWIHCKGEIIERNAENDDKNCKTFNYSYKNCVEVLLEHLRIARSQASAYLGIWMGSTCGVCIIPNFLFDHGGGSFKATMVLVLTEISRTLSMECVGIGNFKESCEVLSKYLFPEINWYIKLLKGSHVVTVEWEDESEGERKHQFDFLLVLNKEVLGADYRSTTHFENRELPSHVTKLYSAETNQ